MFLVDPNAPDMHGYGHDLEVIRMKSAEGMPRLASLLADKFV